MDGHPRAPQLVDQQQPLPADGKVPGRRRWWLVLLVKIAVAGAIIAWLCTDRLDLRRLAQVPLTLDLVLLAALLFGAMLLPAVRWWWLLRIQRIDVSLWRATTLTWVGYATAVILPGAASGDLAKSYLILRQQPEARARSLSTVLVDRMIGVYSLVLLGCLSGGWYVISHRAPPSVWIVFYAMFALLGGSTLALVWILLAPPRRLLSVVVPLAWADAWRESYRLYHRSKRAMIGCLVLSLASSTLVAASLAAADRVLGGAVSWTASLLVGPLVVLANCLPFTPGGIGVAEAAASELFDQVGSSGGAEMMLAIRLVMATLSLPALGLLFGRRRKSASLSPHSGTEATREASTAETPSRMPRAA